MQSADDFYVFEKWRNASGHAFGKEGVAAVVPVDDREAYWRIFSEIRDAAVEAIGAAPQEWLTLRPKGYSRLRGSRGHRPIDLWVSICAEGADLFGSMPQVYAIASARGLEVGFAASIPEDDYFDPHAKDRNRAIVPLINARLPEPSSDAAAKLETELREDGGWIFSTQTRLISTNEGYDQFASLGEMLHHLKTKGASAGGGCIARYYTLQEIHKIDLQFEFELTLSRFGALLEAARPTKWDSHILSDKGKVSAETTLDVFDPSSIEDGRKTVLAYVARRQGQEQFRNSLIKSYGGRCAVTGCDTSDVLQAAHIMPYLGPSTNHPTNGILLRGDIHTLFDLNLIRIDPLNYKIILSPALRYSSYSDLEGRFLSLPATLTMRPSRNALQSRWNSID